MADLILRLPFLSVVSANDVKHMQTVLVWGTELESEFEAQPGEAWGVWLVTGTARATVESPGHFTSL